MTHVIDDNTSGHMKSKNQRISTQKKNMIMRPSPDTLGSIEYRARCERFLYPSGHFSSKVLREMKVLGINGSPRKQNTLKVIEMVMEGITQPGIEKEVINLGSFNIKHCLGCCICLGKYEGPYREEDYHCVQKNKDDVGLIKSKMMKADGIVLGTPIYIMQESGTLKTLIDRLVDMAHVYPLAGKYAASVTTIGLPPERLPMACQSTHDYLKSWIHGLLGAYYVGDLAASFYPELDSCPGQSTESIRKKAHELGAKLAFDMINKTTYPPTEMERRLFAGLRQKVMIMEGGKEAEYWRRKGWLDKDFYI
jgi:multimeric flavodoxin WrbA